MATKVYTPLTVTPRNRLPMTSSEAGLNWQIRIGNFHLQCPPPYITLPRRMIVPANMSNCCRDRTGWYSDVVAFPLTELDAVPGLERVSWSWVMSQPKWSPSLVPNHDQEVHLVLMISARTVEPGERPTSRPPDLETTITGLLEGQYVNPVRVVGFNTAEG
jgi:hypothetical protein